MLDKNKLDVEYANGKQHNMAALHKVFQTASCDNGVFRILSVYYDCRADSILLAGDKEIQLRQRDRDSDVRWQNEYN